LGDYQKKKTPRQGGVFYVLPRLTRKDV